MVPSSTISKSEGFVPSVLPQAGRMCRICINFVFEKPASHEACRLAKVHQGKRPALSQDRATEGTASASAGNATHECEDPLGLFLQDNPSPPHQAEKQQKDPQPVSDKKNEVDFLRPDSPESETQPDTPKTRAPAQQPADAAGRHNSSRGSEPEAAATPARLDAGPSAQGNEAASPAGTVQGPQAKASAGNTSWELQLSSRARAWLSRHHFTVQDVQQGNLCTETVMVDRGILHILFGEAKTQRVKDIYLELEKLLPESAFVQIPGPRAKIKGWQPINNLCENSIPDRLWRANSSLARTLEEDCVVMLKSLVKHGANLEHKSAFTSVRAI